MNCVQQFNWRVIEGWRSIWLQETSKSLCQTLHPVVFQSCLIQRTSLISTPLHISDLSQFQCCIILFASGDGSKEECLLFASGDGSKEECLRSQAHTECDCDCYAHQSGCNHLQFPRSELVLQIQLSFCWEAGYCAQCAMVKWRLLS
jgi:hypothetical protein